VFVDMKSHELLAGATIDFVVAIEGAGFTFENPNATSPAPAASRSADKSFAHAFVETVKKHRKNHAG